MEPQPHAPSGKTAHRVLGLACFHPLAGDLLRVFGVVILAISTTCSFGPWRWRERETDRDILGIIGTEDRDRGVRTRREERGGAGAEGGGRCIMGG